MHASRIGVKLPEKSVVGYVNEWINMGKISRNYEDRPRRVWRVVDETAAVLYDDEDIMDGTGANGEPVFVEGDWESELGWTDCTQ